MKNLFRPLYLLIAVSFLCLASTVHAQHVTSTIPVSGYPSAVALNPATNRIYEVCQ